VGISQAFYRFENTSEHLVIDLAVLALSSPGKHLEPSVHGHAVFHFNKGDRIDLQYSRRMHSSRGWKRDWIDEVGVHRTD
jgi:hypothetical protein